MDVNGELLAGGFVRRIIRRPECQRIVGVHGPRPSSAFAASGDEREALVVVEAGAQPALVAGINALERPQCPAALKAEIESPFAGWLDQLPGGGHAAVRIELAAKPMEQLKEKPVFVEGGHVPLAGVVNLVAAAPVDLGVVIETLPDLQNLTVSRFALQNRAGERQHPERRNFSKEGAGENFIQLGGEAPGAVAHRMPAFILLLAENLGGVGEKITELRDGVFDESVFRRVGQLLLALDYGCGGQARLADAAGGHPGVKLMRLRQWQAVAGRGSLAVETAARPERAGQAALLGHCPQLLVGEGFDAAQRGVKAARGEGLAEKLDLLLEERRLASPLGRHRHLRGSPGIEEELAGLGGDKFEHALVLVAVVDFQRANFDVAGGEAYAGPAFLLDVQPQKAAVGTGFDAANVLV